MRTKVSELMTDNPVSIESYKRLMDAARIMKEINCGVLPVEKEGKIVGMITDRDIIIRAVAEGKNPLLETIDKYMTDRVIGCNQEDFLEDAADKMRLNKVSRLIVKNHDGEVTGILSFGGILRKQADSNEIANVVRHAIYKKVA